MTRIDGLSATQLLDYGVRIEDGNDTVTDFRFERPTMVHGHRLKSCSMGAYGFYNAAGLASAYRTHFGRYSQVGESTIVGPPEHPMTMFSTHPFAFARPSHLPKMYEMPDFARICPENDQRPAWADAEVATDTYVGHEAYVGAGSFIRRGVRVGNGAVIGACSVVTRDIPDFAIVAGSPAKVLRMRFSDAMIERLQKLAWWHYDLGPIKTEVNWREVERTVAFLEDAVAAGRLQPLQPECYRVTTTASGDYAIERLDAPLY